MITLAKRPQPMPERITRIGRQLSEVSYGILMADQCRRERQLKQRGYLSDYDYLDVMVEPMTVDEIAREVERDVETVRSRMYAFERIGMVKRTGARPEMWVKNG